MTMRHLTTARFRFGQAQVRPPAARQPTILSSPCIRQRRSR